jgi:two-component system cell cycle response regulator
LDVDHFKTINDSLGHGGGDAVLKELGRRVRSQLRNYDGLGRYGGEEFLLVLPGCDLTVTLSRAEEIRRSIANLPFVSERGRSLVTVSMGVTVAQNASLKTYQALLHDADVALYCAKNRGRNCIEHSIVSN